MTLAQQTAVEIRIGNVGFAAKVNTIAGALQAVRLAHRDELPVRTWAIMGQVEQLLAEAVLGFADATGNVASGSAAGSDAKGLALSWLAAASERNSLAHQCRADGSIEDAIPLENAANAYERCARELKKLVEDATVRQPPQNK